MKKTAKLLVAISMLTLATYTNAQVTIGTGTKSAPGALLQLKENDNLDANATKGLLLPRLQLTAHNLDSIKTAPTDTPDMYVGLTVWNIRGVGDICKGVQVWDGSKWVSPMPKPKDHTNYNPETGILTDYEGNTYKTANFGEAGIWMTENLRTTQAPSACENVFYPNELTANDFSLNMHVRIASYPAPNGTTGGGEKPATWKPEYGMIYSWALATNGKGGPDGKGNEDGPQEESMSERIKKRQGICPNGWHLPALYEWDKLLTVLEEDATAATPLYADYDNQTNAVGARGGITSAKSNTPVRAAVIPYGASKSADKGGFNVFLTGSSTMRTDGYGDVGYFWSANSGRKVDNPSSLEYHAQAEGIYFKPEVTSYTSMATRNSARRTNLYSVRCVKDK